ncbi:electron transfer flavoprotein subunit beta/FixA family protein [Chloroflexota bacterium]
MVCIKQVPDTEGVIGIDRIRADIKKENLPLVVNPYDLLAVEEAVRLREKSGSGQVTAVSMGPSSAQDALRHCLAMGADRGLILCDESFDGSDSYATAIALAKVIAQLQGDLVLCGQKALDTESGQVGAVIARSLGIPLVSAVVGIEVCDDGTRLRVQRKLDRGAREIVEVPLPVLLAVEMGSTKPRPLQLRSVLAAKKKVIEEYDLKALGLSTNELGPQGSKTKVLSISPPKPRSTQLFQPDPSLPAAKQLGLLMTGGVTQRENKLLIGEPESIAAELVGFLCEKGLLRIS